MYDESRTGPAPEPGSDAALLAAVQGNRRRRHTPRVNRIRSAASTSSLSSDGTGASSSATVQRDTALVTVKRDDVVGSVIAELYDKIRDGHGWRKLSVGFDGEPGLDASGLSAELVSLYFSDMVRTATFGAVPYFVSDNGSAVCVCECVCVCVCVRARVFVVKGASFRRFSDSTFRHTPPPFPPFTLCLWTQTG